MYVCMYVFIYLQPQPTEQRFHSSFSVCFFSTVRLLDASLKIVAITKEKKKEEKVTVTIFLICQLTQLLRPWKMHISQGSET